MTESQALHEKSAEREAFWSYRDLAVFFVFSIPALIAGALLMKLAIYLLGLRVHSKAFEALPAQYVGVGLLFLFLYVLFKTRYRRPFWRSLGWAPSPWSFGAGLVLGVMLAFAVALIGSLLKTPDIPSPMKDLLSDWTSIALVAFFATTIGPVCEEVIFRGFVQPLLVRSLGAVAGVLVTSISFGLLHLAQYAYSWRHALLVALAATAFGWARHKSGSTRTSAVMHAAYNGTMFVAYLVQRKGPAVW